MKFKSSQSVGLSVNTLFYAINFSVIALSGNNTNDFNNCEPACDVLQVTGGSELETYLFQYFFFLIFFRDIIILNISTFTQTQSKVRPHLSATS